jgi:hypothetical protein
MFPSRTLTGENAERISSQTQVSATHRGISRLPEHERETCRFPNPRHSGRARVPQNQRQTESRNKSSVSGGRATPQKRTKLVTKADTTTIPPRLPLARANPVGRPSAHAGRGHALRTRMCLSLPSSRTSAAPPLPALAASTGSRSRGRALIEGVLDCGFAFGLRAATDITKLRRRLRCRTTCTAGWEASGVARRFRRHRLRRSGRGGGGSR